jgi:hypothetical protein
VSDDDGAASNQKRTPCRSKSVVARAPCLSRVRDGDGAGGKSAGGPIPKAPHPQERGCKARGTECGNLDRAAPSEIDCERVGGLVVISLQTGDAIQARQTLGPRARLPEW